VHGIKVFGTTYKQDQGGSGDDDFWAFFHPKTFGEWVGLIATFLGLAMGIEWIGAKGWSAVKWYRNRNKPPQPSEIEQMRTDLNSLGVEIRAAQQRILDRLGNAEVRVPDQNAMPQAQQNGRAELANVNNVARAEAEIDVFEAQARQVGVVAEYGVNRHVQQAENGIRQGAQDVEKALNQNEKGVELQIAVNKGAQAIRDVQPHLDAAIKEVGNKISASNEAQIKESQLVQSDASRIAENAEHAAEKGGKGEGADGEDPIEVVEK
jgi:hypothetical protein